ncbi:MAG: Na/Pi cotransporter family protein [Spirochaetaceae bacterium]|jgi:phosphate:Na+ symporter|nr:Na/Pi cotransporter family protein [Spirochaetaceae bacterium]GMO28928.1 MAG: Na/Pi cotransporter family protein [Termitinemataceae bacterium]
MNIIVVILRIGGSLCLFLYGMKVLSEGIQQSAGARLQGALRFMTGHRLSAVFTGFSVTAIIQSSSATTSMVVSFVNAGLLTLKQSIGVIMGANIGTTVTAWIVSLIGFSLKISTLALPAIGIGFVLAAFKWKHREVGNMVMGFGLLFLGLDFLTRSMPGISAEDLAFIRRIAGDGFGATLVGLAIGIVITAIMQSSSATTAIIITMAHNGIIDMNFGCVMILGANIGTTIDAMLASIGTSRIAKRSALVHVLFNFFGSLWAVFFIKPLISLVELISPGEMPQAIGAHLAMFHTVFNTLNTCLFLPFVGPFANFVSLLIKDKKEPERGVYKISYIGSMRDPPEMGILYAENEIRDMAGVSLSMFRSIRASLASLNETTIEKLIPELNRKEDYADQMREEITRFLLELNRRNLNINSEHNISLLIRIIADIEDLTDDCYSIGLLLERSVKKKQIFKQEEIDALNPYMGMVEDFLGFVERNLGRKLSMVDTGFAKKTEEEIDHSRDVLRKLGRKRIEAGENVKTELLFIDLVRRIERLGDYCYSISALLANIKEA